MASRIFAVALSLLAFACDGEQDAPSLDAATVGKAGGKVLGPDGASVTVPAGALHSDVTLRVTKDATGAPVPVLHEDLTRLSDIYAFTPHGVRFDEPVTVSLPFDADRLTDEEQPVIVKSQPGGEWDVHLDVRRDGDRIEGEFDGFSYFYAATLRIADRIKTVPFAIGLSAVAVNEPDNPERRVTFEISGQPPSCSGGGAYVTEVYNVTDWSQSTDPLFTDQYGGVGPVVVTATGEFPVPNAIVAASPQRFTSTFLQAVNRTASSSSGVITASCVGCGVIAIASAQVRARYHCLQASGVELRIVGGNALGYPPFVAAQGIALLADTLTDTLQPGERPEARVTVMVPYVERKPEAGVYWDKSVDQGASWQQIGFAPALEATPDPDFPQGGSRPPLRHALMLPPVSLSDDGAQIRARYCTGATQLQCAPATPELVRGLPHTMMVFSEPQPPQFVQSPESMLVQSGQSASFAVEVTGMPRPALQWQRRAPGGASWLDIDAATSPDYTTPILTREDSGSELRVVASNSAGDATSDVAVLVVSDAPVPPRITSQPLDLSVVSGSEAVFAVVAGGTPPLGYQWQRDGVAIPGANGTSLKLQAVTPADGGAYAVEVSNASGQVISAGATLSVSESGVATPEAPSILTQPASLVVAPGAAATLAVSASGTGPLAYQWRRNGSDLAGATSPVLHLGAVSLLDAGSYVVTVSNSAGTVTSGAAELVLLGAPAITVQPAGAATTAGATVTFSVTATGALLRHQWMRDDVAIPGATGTTYTTPALTLADDAGRYSVLVYNGAGVVVSQDAVLTVTQPAVAQWQTGLLIETDDAGNAEGPQVAVNADGDAVAVWEQSNGTSNDVYANLYTAATGWGDFALISSEVGGAQNAQAVAIDDAGNAIAVWQQSDSIWANRYSAGGGWGTATLIETESGFAGNPQVAVDGSGNATAVFWQRHGARLDSMSNRYVAGSGWGTAVAIETDDLGDVSAPHVAVDAGGNAVAVWAWAADTGGSNFIYDVWSNRYVPGTGWSGAAPIGNADSQAPNPAPYVALDPDGNAIAVWEEIGLSGYFDVWANRRAVGGAWGTPVLLESDDSHSARSARVAIGADGGAVAVWAHSDGSRDNVVASRYTAGTGWGSPVLIETDNAGSAFAPQVVIDGTGDATAVWYQRNVAGFTFDIWANRYTAASGWGEALIIDGSTNPARGVQIGVDGGGNVVAVWEQGSSVTSIWSSTLETAAGP